MGSKDSFAQFTFDGDGKRVKSVIGAETILFAGAHYEKKGTTVTKYYFAGGQRIAMRKNDTLTYMLTDHLGSTSLTTDTSGAVISELRYGPWGNVRYQGGTTSTPYQYTGQYSYQSDFGLYFYNARWYDPALGRFTAADSLVPGGAQGLDRFAYVNNNPVMYTDPSGHEPHGPGSCYSENDPNCSIFDGGWNDPKYSTWNRLRRGSPCTACHVTHWSGKIPTNDEIDSSLVDYYRSMDNFSQQLHIYAAGYIGYVANETQFLTFGGDTGYIVTSQEAYDVYKAEWGQHHGQVFVTNDEGLQLVYQQDSVAGVNQVLGTKFPIDKPLRVVQVDNIWLYNPTLPTGGNEFWVSGGYTIGGAPERVIAPLAGCRRD